jgi:hypothetical protein
MRPGSISPILRGRQRIKQKSVPGSSEHWIDRLAKRLAGRASRRQVLGRTVAGVAAAAVASLLPRRAGAYLQGEPCTPPG